jgi:hypothetical protein
MRAIHRLLHLIIRSALFLAAKIRRSIVLYISYTYRIYM